MQRTLPPTFFRLASSWSMMPDEVVITNLPNCSHTAPDQARMSMCRSRQTAAQLHSCCCCCCVCFCCCCCCCFWSLSAINCYHCSLQHSSS